MIDFRQIKGPKNSKAGNFEEMCSQLILSKFPSAKPVEGKGGDRGCDLFTGGDFNWNDIRVFQYKYFCETLSRSQKRHIEESLKVAIDHWEPWCWVLCMPKNLTPSEHVWFKNLEKKYCNYGEARKRPRKKLAYMLFWGETLLRSMLYEYPHIRTQFFPVYLTPEQSDQIRSIVTEVVTNLPEELSFISSIKNIAKSIGLNPVSIQYDIVDWVAQSSEGFDLILSSILRLNYEDAKHRLSYFVGRTIKDKALKYLLLGNCHFAFKEYLNATEAYKKCLDTGYYKTIVYNNLGVCYRRLGAFDDAINNFSKAIEINPSLAESYCNRAVIKKLCGEYASAKEDLDKAISLNHEIFEAYYNRAIVHGRLGNFELAMKDFEKAEPILQTLDMLGKFNAGNSDFIAVSLWEVLETHAHNVAQIMNPYLSIKWRILATLRNVCPEDISRLRWFIDKYVEKIDKMMWDREHEESAD